MDQTDLLYKEFLRFQEAKNEQSKSLDNVIFIVATGIFVLSINYLGTVRNEKLSHPLLLLISWISLLTCLAFHMFAYKMSVQYHFKYSQQLLTNQAFTAKDKYEKIINLLNTLTLVLLLVGMILLTVFVSINFIRFNR